MQYFRPQHIAILGLGYVGLSLAVELARQFRVTGFDVDELRAFQLSAGHDRNGLIPSSVLTGLSSLTLTADEANLDGADFFVVAVPTPVDALNLPDLANLDAACHMVGSHLAPRSVVVFESTVYPGCTESVCIPILEAESGLRVATDFGVGYSPERIDPGNPDRVLANIVKIISATDEGTLDTLSDVYGSVVTAGLHRAPNIRTAEASKVIENVQRDLNIALMNELSMIFNEMEIDTDKVLEAARTKWNFIDFYPGLVGGHCIPVDPYYLVYQAAAVGHVSKVIVAGREVNDGMPRYIATQVLARLAKVGIDRSDARVLVLGQTFKEDVKDTRNSGAVQLVQALADEQVAAHTSDPIVDTPTEVGIWTGDPLNQGEIFDIVCLAVPHLAYRETDVAAFVELLGSDGMMMDIRGILEREAFETAGLAYWTL
jgi:UDP-N-acetyl-D-galactosamine dehydrogenase